MNVKRLWFLVLTTCLLMSCSSDDPENNGGVKPVPTPTPSGANATITFSVSSDNGQGTAVQPFTASPGKPLNATLSQTVTYTDAQGQKQTVEPKATIAATVKTDTIHAADFAALTKLTQPQPKTVTKAGNPKTATQQQLFNIGGQEITFDLSHEIYSYTNGSSQDVELPYLELKSPKFGSATPNEISNTRAVQGFGSMPVVSVTAIRLTPIGPLTRSTTVRDTTQYEVTVSFTIDAVTHHTASDAVQPLSADIHYVAVVENVTEIPNASTSLICDIEHPYLEGATNKQSPFTFTAKQDLHIEWPTESRCTYIAAEDLTARVITQNPRAAINVTFKADTIFTEENKESLSVVSATEPTFTTYEDQPKLTSAKQTFTIGGQTVTVVWKYEDYGSVVVEDSTVAMPYLQVGAPEVVELTVTETAQSQTARSRLAGKTYTMQKGQTRADGDSDINNMQDGVFHYEVTARFRQQLKGMNTQEPFEESVEYVVKYIAVIGAKLISTTYEKDYEWFEPWCDYPWRYQYIVRRIRTYSTGEQETDEFRLPVYATAPVGGSTSYQESDFAQIKYHNINYDKNNDDFRFILTTKTGVRDISNLQWKIYDDADTWNNRDLNRYRLLFTDTLFNYSNPIENWYRETIERVRAIELYYDDFDYIRIDFVYINFGDYFLYLDGQIIDFPEYRMTYDCNISVENINFDGAPAKVFTNEIKGKYLGKDFYAATVDTVYQIK